MQVYNKKQENEMEIVALVLQNIELQSQWIWVLMYEATPTC